MKRFFVLSVAMLMAVAGFSQTKKVTGVTGRCEFSRFITREQAEAKALQEAKVQALEKAEVSLNVWSVLGVVSEDDGQELYEVYSEMSSVALGGMVRITKGPVYSEETDPADMKTYVVALIDAEVKVGEHKEDKTYALKMDGISSVYKVGDVITFSAEVFGHDSYLKIFWFDDNGGMVQFPNEYEPDMVFSAGKKYQFPINKNLEYVAELTRKNADMERVNLIAVATKKNFPFLTEEVTFETILSWIYGLDASDRSVSYQTFIVKK